MSLPNAPPDATDPAPARPLEREPLAGAQPMQQATAPAAPDMGRMLIRIALVFCGAIAICLLAYLAFAVPGPWLTHESPVVWEAKDLRVARGTGAMSGDELVLTAPDATGTAVVSVATDIRSSDYPGIVWSAADVPEDASAYLLWQSDYATGKVNTAPIRVEAGHLMPIVMAKHPQWIGRIKGIALAIRNPLQQPVRIRGVVAKPMGAFELLRDRAREWLAFEGWTGTSINTVTGGADVQDLPLPMLLAVSIALSAVALAAWRRLRPTAKLWHAGPVVVVLFAVAWFLLDARWTFNLARQNVATAEQFAGKSWRDKHLAMEDAQLFAFLEKARDVMPRTPARVFVVADEAYYRQRAAYHLYPQNVYSEPLTHAMPPAARLRAGDWLLVYQRKGVQYDSSQQKLHWDGSQTVSAEAKLVEPGAALFLIR